MRPAACSPPPIWPTEATGDDGVDARQAAIEERIRQTVTDIVEGVVGPGNARVQVTRRHGFQPRQRNLRTFDPEGRVVRSTLDDGSHRHAATSARKARPPAPTCPTPPAPAAGGGLAEQQHLEPGNRQLRNLAHDHDRSERRRRDQATLGRGRGRRRHRRPAPRHATAAYQPRSAEEMQRLTRAGAIRGRLRQDARRHGRSRQRAVRARRSAEGSEATAAWHVRRHRQSRHDAHHRDRRRADRLAGLRVLRAAAADRAD